MFARIEGHLKSKPQVSVLMLFVALIPMNGVAQSPLVGVQTLSGSQPSSPKPVEENTIPDPFGGKPFPSVKYVPSGIGKATLAKAKWKRLLPTIRETEEKRKALLQEYAVASENFLKAAKAATDYDDFIGKAQSLQSKFKFVVDRDAEIQRLHQRFKTHLVPIQDIEIVLKRAICDLHKQLTAIDNQALVALSIDTEFDSSNLPLPDTKTLQTVSSSTTELVVSLTDAVQRIIDEDVIATGASFALGGIMEQAAREHLAYDQYGNHSLMGEMEAIGWGILVGGLAEVASKSVINADGKLRTTISNGLDSVYEALLSRRSPWRSSYASLVAKHDSLFVDCLIKELGVDRDWAISQLK